MAKPDENKTECEAIIRQRRNGAVAEGLEKVIAQLRSGKISCTDYYWSRPVERVPLQGNKVLKRMEISVFTMELEHKD